MNERLIPEYTIDYISNVMDLRKPQIESLKILDSILDYCPLSKNSDLKKREKLISEKYEAFTSFEHDFMSLAFVLATGVGKTRLMGAFITYLYAQKGVRNFLVVAPNITIYEKLKNDLGNPSPDNEKYVFRGVDCFAHNQPEIWEDDDYRDRPVNSLLQSGPIRIFIFNISKFNSDEENRKMKKTNEYIGDSFFNYLASIQDLVILMDESHHYRSGQSALAINDLNPVLGLELTATPHTEKNGKTVYFKNVVYDYSLSKAINDGYTRTPYAMTRRNIQAYNLDDDSLDRAMINDGISHHENIKIELEEYADTYNVKKIKPFVLIVCKDTEHANKVMNYICSDDFRDGKYKDKVAIVHSNQKGDEADENIKKLLEVEKYDNPIEIVIHVNKLKEGWDVNNLYTIIPLRTATSRTLREQTIGRGLRLPYGKRTGVRNVDSVTITAHDKFNEIITEAQRGDSIFKAENLIYADDEVEKKIIVNKPTSISSPEFEQKLIKYAGLGGIGSVDKYQVELGVVEEMFSKAIHKISEESPEKKIKKEDIKKTFESGDVGNEYKENTNIQLLIDAMFQVEDEDVIEKFQDAEMFIPKLATEKIGSGSYVIEDFDLDFTNLNFEPITDEVIIKNILDSYEETFVEKTSSITNGMTLDVEQFLIQELRDIPEIDYDQCADILHKIVMQFIAFLDKRFNGNRDSINNVCILYRNDIVSELKKQFLQHLKVKYEGLVDTIDGIETIVDNQMFDYEGDIKDIYSEPNGDIKSILYCGGRKSITKYFKFDSNPERIFGIVCDSSPEVVKWLRPSPKQFNITYNGGHRYQPDFVVETSDCYYLVEVKSTKELDNPDVIAKKERALEYCKIASEYNLANGHKPFEYLFIPHDQINMNVSFDNLKTRFIEK